MDDISCVNFLLCDPAGTSNKLNVQNEWEENTHTTHTTDINTPYFVWLLTFVKKKGPVAFSLSTLRNMICAVLGCCGTEQDFSRRLSLGTVRNLLVSVGF